MIIQAVQAENLFKYTTLSLAGLEGKRRILLSGPNESGKTAVIEAISLGLFGRTASHETTQLAKVIKWGENNASVTVTFLGRHNQSHTVYRYFDSTGASQASLSPAGAEEPVAKGVEAVNAAVINLVGFDFQHYIDTLCLTQSAVTGGCQASTIKSLAGVAELDDLTSALEDEIHATQQQGEEDEAQIQALEEQVDLLDLDEQALDTLARQKTDAEAQVVAIDADKTRWQTFVTEMQLTRATIESAALRLLQCGMDSTLDAWQGRIKNLAQSLDALDTVCQKNQVEMEISPVQGLRARVDALQERFSALTHMMASVTKDRQNLMVWLGDAPGGLNAVTRQKETTRIREEQTQFAKQRTRNGRWGLLALIVALLVGGSAGLLYFRPESTPALTIATLLQTHVPGWNPSMAVYLLGTAGLFLIVALRGISRSFSLRGRMANHHLQLETIEARARDAREQVQTIDAAFQEPLPKQVATLTQLEMFEWVTGLLKWADSVGSVLLNAKANKKFLSEFQGELEAFRQELATYESDIAHQMEASHSEQTQHEENILQLDAQMETEKERRAQDQALRAQIAEREAGRAKQAHVIQVRRVACDLLKGACQGLSLRFNQELLRFIAGTAPLFTQDRYQHIRIDDGMNVAAFSTIKNDFVDFCEISTGVRYQLLLAVRMALVQALTARTDSAPQCVVLDEPFVFFDRQRVRESLKALPLVSEEIAQLWIIAQEHDEANMDTSLDVHLRCTVEEDALIVA